MTLVSRLAEQFARSELVGQFVLSPSLDAVPAGWRSRTRRSWALGAHPALPVLFVSGYMNDTDDRLDLHAPGRSFLQKPFAPSELLERVRRQLAETSTVTR